MGVKPSSVIGYLASLTVTLLSGPDQTSGVQKGRKRGCRGDQNVDVHHGNQARSGGGAESGRGWVPVWERVRDLTTFED